MQTFKIFIFIVQYCSVLCFIFFFLTERHVGSELPTQESNTHPSIGRWHPNHWTTREVLLLIHFKDAPRMSSSALWLILLGYLPKGHFSSLSSNKCLILSFSLEGVCVLVAQSCPTLCDPTGPLSMGFSRQEHWSGLSIPSLGYWYIICLVLGVVNDN